MSRVTASRPLRASPWSSYTRTASFLPFTPPAALTWFDGQLDAVARRDAERRWAAGQRADLTRRGSDEDGFFSQAKPNSASDAAMRDVRIIATPGRDGAL
jgi:hypothetical protein